MKSYNIKVLMELSGVKFGTSGARGLADNMTDEVCYAYTVAFLQHLENVGNIAANSSVAISGDLRPSTPRICAAVAKAVEDKGYTPMFCGYIPSPAVALFGFVNHMPSVMVTGSHIPDDRNGIKYNTSAGEILKSDEEGMRSQVVELSEQQFDNTGFFTSPYTLPVINPEAEELYVKRYTDYFRADALTGLKVGVYEHSCVGRDVMKKIYESLGAEVYGLGRNEIFIPVDTEAIRPEDVELAKNWSREGSLDAILSADGDCDRPLTSDENGHWLRGDISGILCSAYLSADAVVTPVSCNTAVESSGLFKQVTRTRIGSPYVISGMKEADASGDFSTIVGYEANGGFLLNSSVENNSRTLEALPTRDAVIVHIALLADAKAKNCKLSELVKGLPARFTASNRLKEFPTELSQLKLKQFTEGDFAENKQAIEAAFSSLSGSLKAIDTTDGVRMTFDNEEIIHLRPSGNAPELRCYSEADSESRVRELNDACISLMSSWR